MTDQSTDHCREVTGLVQHEGSGGSPEDSFGAVALCEVPEDKWNSSDSFVACGPCLCQEGHCDKSVAINACFSFPNLALQAVKPFTT